MLRAPVRDDLPMPVHPDPADRRSPQDPRPAVRAQPPGGAWATASPGDGKLTLVLTGDVMSGRGVDQAMRHPVDPTLHESWVKDAREYLRLAEAAHGPVPRPVPAAYPWGAALEAMALRAPALRIVNLETAVTTAPTPWPGKGIHYRMHPAHVDFLQVAGIDACTLANNHVLDWGRDGLAQTLDSLRAAGIRTAGAGRDEDEAMAPAVWPLPAARLLLFAVAEPDSGVPRAWAADGGSSGVALLPDLSPSSADRLARHIAAHRGPGDLVVLSIHWGGNWGLDIPPAHRRFARRLIDAGAVDLLHGHSSHHPMPLEIHRGRLVLYGCGDLVNDYEGIGGTRAQQDLPGDIGCLHVATLRLDDHTLADLEIVPFQRRRLRLEPAGDAQRDWLARHVMRASTPDPRVRLADGGAGA